MSCKIMLRNGNESELFKTLLKITNNNESEAEALYSHFKRPSFIEGFGDYHKALDNSLFSDRLDANGEPKLFLNETNNTYHYVNKEGVNVSFPPKDSPVETMFNGETIRSISHYLGMSFLQETRNANISEFDLVESINEIGLKDFIKDKFTKRIAELDTQKGIEAIKQKTLIKKVLPHVNDLIPHIQDFYKTMNMTYTENNEDSADVEYSEGTRDAAFGKNSYESDSVKNIRRLTKLKLATLKDPNGYNPLFGEAYINYAGLAGLLMEKLNDNYSYLDVNGDIVDIGNNLIKQLELLVPKRPELAPVVEEAYANESFKGDLVISFKNQRNHILSDDLVTAKDGKVSHVTRNNSANASYAKSLRETWNTEFYTHFFGDNVVTKSETEARAKLTTAIDSLVELKAKINATPANTYDNNHANLVAEFTEILTNNFGISVDVIAVSDVFDVAKTTAQLKTDVVTLISKFEADVRQIRDKRVKAMTQTTNSSFDLINHSDALRLISIEQATRSDANTDLNVIAGNKRVYIMSNINYLKNRIEVWKRAPHLMEAFFNNQSAYYKGSEFLSFLTAQKERAVMAAGNPHVTPEIIQKTMMDRINSVDIGILTDLFVDNEGVTNEESEIQKQSFADYLASDFNKVIANKYFRSTTQADKDSNFQIIIREYAKQLFISYDGSHKNGNLYEINDETIDIFQNYLQSELSRMVEAYDTIEKTTEAVKAGQNVDLSKIIIHYHYAEKGGLTYTKEGDKVTDFKVNIRGNAFKSQLLPGLNFVEGNTVSYKGTNLRRLQVEELAKEIRARIYEYDKDSPRYGTISESMINKKSAVGDINLFEIASVDANNNVDFELQNMIRSYIRMVLSDNIQETYNELVNNGVIEHNENGLVSSIKVDTEYAAKYSKANNLLRTDNSKDTLAKALATEYTLRSIINNVEYSKLFTGDMAYYKNMVDYKKRVPATYTDGLTMYIDKNEDLMFNAAVIDGVITASPYHDAMVKTYGEAVADKYKDINSTDAQGWITPERWKFIMTKLRKWTPAHDSLYEKMNDPNPRSYTVEELKIAASPVKGVYFGINNETGAPTYLKYSQAVLTPRLVKNTPLEKIYEQMKAQNVQEVITLDGVKVGSPVTTKTHNSDGSMIEEFNFNVLPLSNLDWKMQQDLPVKTFKDTEVGSQIQKNIFAGLIHNPDIEFEYDGRIITGREIMDEIATEIGALSDKGLSKMMREFGVDPVSLKIQDVDRYYSTLIDELKSRGGSRNIIEALEKRMSIAGIPQSRSKLNNVFAAIVNKRIIKIKTNGGSFIQMSNYGLNYTEATAEGAGIILHPNFKHLVNRTNPNGEQTSYTSFEPHAYTDPETGRERIAPAGVFISGSFIAKYIPDYAKYSPEQLFGKYEDGKLVEKGIIDPRILEGLVGYRIPNQGMASNDALQIVGILPEENGDTIVSFTGITTKTGSDFDIDKQYLMMPSFSVSVTDAGKRTTLKALQSKLRGATLKESILNFKNLYNQLTEEEFKDSEIEDFYNTKFENDEIQNIRKESENKLVDLLFSNLDNPVTLDLLDQLGFDTQKRLVYVDKEYQKGYHENRLIQLYKSVLTHPQLIKDVMLPIDFEFMKTDIVDLTESISGDTNTPYYHMSPIADIQLMYAFRNGKAGVGQEANWMVDISRRGDLSLNNFYSKWFNKNLDSENIDESIHARDALLGNIKLDRLHAVNLNPTDLQEYLDDMRESFKRNGVKPDKIEEAIANLRSEIVDVKISSSMTAVLNGFVDIAKDPFITRGNWVTSTTNTANFLLRIGVHPLYVNAFMAQPILRDYSDKIKTIKPRKGLTPTDAYLINLTGDHLNSLYDNNRTGLSLDVLRDFKIGEFYKLKAKPESFNFPIDEKGLPVKDDKNIYLNTYSGFSPSTILSNMGIKKNSPNYEQALAEAVEISKYLYDFHNEQQNTNEEVSVETTPLRVLRNQVKNAEFDFKLQKDVLKSFLVYKDATQKLREVMTIGKMDTSGVGDSITNMLGFINLYNKLSKPNEKGIYVGGFKTRFDKSPLGVYFGNLFKAYNIAKANPELFNSAKHENIVTTNNVAFKLTNENAMDSELIKLIEGEMYHDMMDSFFGMTAQEKISLLRDLPTRILSEKQKDPDNLLIRSLTVSTPKKMTLGNVRSLIKMSNSQRNTPQQDAISKDWNDLFKTDPQLASDLVKYSFLTTGFNNNNGQFFSYIPHQYFLRKDLNKHVRNYITPADFADRFVANNYEHIKVGRHIKRIDGVLQSVENDKHAKYLQYPPNETPSMYIKKGEVIYKMIAQKDNSDLFIYIPIDKTGISIDGKTVAEYGETVASQARDDKERATLEERAKSLDKLLNIKSIEELYTNTEFTDHVGGTGVFAPRISHPDTIVESKFTLNKSPLYVDNFENSYINTNRYINNGKDFGMFSNIFNATYDNGFIKVFAEKMDANEVNSVIKGFGDTTGLISNIEYTSVAYMKWLTKGDNQHIPADKINSYNELRENILNEINNPESELNKSLDKGYKFAVGQNMLHGITYTTHADLLAQYVADKRQERMYPSGDVTNTAEVTSNLDQSINTQEVNIIDVRELAELNKNREVIVKYDKYKNSFKAIVIGSELISETVLKNDITGETSIKDQIYHLQLKTNTGKIITASEFEIEGLITTKTGLISVAKQQPNTPTNQTTSQQNQQVQTSLFDNISATESEINNLIERAIKQAIKTKTGNGASIIHQLESFRQEALLANLTTEEVENYIKKCLNI